MASKQKYDRPLLVREWAGSIKVKKATKVNKDVFIQLDKKTISRPYQKNIKQQFDRKTGMLQIFSKTREIGVHSFPPNIKATPLNKKLVSKGEEINKVTEGFHPDHLRLTQFPNLLEKKLQVRSRFTTNKKRGKDISDPSAVFGRDDRYVFSDTSFPWCTCGKVETEAGWGSGVMIGPRHLMTASHVIVWKPGETCGWVKFTPLKFDGSEPFGVAWATRVFFWNKADGSDGLDLKDGAFDYVVCVLDTDIGNLTGWMGSRGYDPAWNGGNYWGHVGYPQDIAGGTRPSFIGYQSFIDQQTGSAAGRDSYRIRHEIDVIPGQSGGPYFGWWPSEPWPRVVGIQSGINLGGPTGDNTCGGGNPLSELINYVRTNVP